MTNEPKDNPECMALALGEAAVGTETIRSLAKAYRMIAMSEDGPSGDSYTVVRIGDALMGQIARVADDMNTAMGEVECGLRRLSVAGDPGAGVAPPTLRPARASGP